MAGSLLLTTVGRNKWILRRSLGQSLRISYCKFGVGRTADADVAALVDLATNFNPVVSLALSTKSQFEEYVRYTFQDLDLTTNYEATEIGVFDEDDVLIFYASAAMGNLFEKAANRGAAMWVGYTVENSMVTPLTTLDVVAGVALEAAEGRSGIAAIATQDKTDEGLEDNTIVSPLKLANWWDTLDVVFSKFSGRTTGNQIGFATIGCEHIAQNLQFTERISNSDGAIVASLTNPKIAGIVTIGASGIHIEFPPNPIERIPILVLQNIVDGVQLHPHDCGFSGGVFSGFRLHATNAPQSERYEVGDSIFFTSTWEFSKLSTNMSIGKVLEVDSVSLGLYTVALDFWTFAAERTDAFTIGDLASEIPARGDRFAYADVSEPNVPNKSSPLEDIFSLIRASDITSEAFALTQMPTNVSGAIRIGSNSSTFSASKGSPKLADVIAVGDLVEINVLTRTRLPLLVLRNVNSGDVFDDEEFGYYSGVFNDIRLHVSTLAVADRFSVGDFIYLASDWTFTKVPTPRKVGIVLALATGVGRYDIILNLWESFLTGRVLHVEDTEPVVGNWNPGDIWFQREA